MKPAIEGVIFDLDGTLVDSLRDIADALNAALGDAGHPTHSLPAVAAMVGDGAAALVDRATPRGMDRVPVTRAFARRYGDNAVTASVPFPGIAQLLADLVERRIGLAVLSNKPDVLLQAVVQRLFAAKTFVAAVGQREGVPHKPDPTEALRLAAALHAEPRACVLVGDSPVDVQTGHAAGMRTIAVTWGFRSRAELQAAGPDLIVDDASALRAQLLAD